MSRRKKNAGLGYGYMFHGAFKDKADAKAKERKTKGAWIKGTYTKQGHRYLVMSPRLNPIKRKKHNSTAWEGGKHDTEFFREALRTIAPGQRYEDLTAAEKRRVRALAQDLKTQAKAERNPHELLIMGANPVTRKHKHFPRGTPAQKVYSFAGRMRDNYPGRKIDVQERVDGSWDVYVLNEPISNPISIRANPEPRPNWMGLGKEMIEHAHESMVPRLARRLRARAREAGQHARASTRRFRAQERESEAQFRSLRRSARAAMPKTPGRVGGKAKLNELFHELYGRNPSAAALREEFTGTPAEAMTVTDEPHMPAGDYAQLGELLALYVKPGHGQQVQHITFRKPWPLVVSDESARQIYFVGGDQDVSSALETFGASAGGHGLVELGEARRIDYKQRKEHVSDPDTDEWRHDFGEESGVRPILLFDPKHKRLLLEGGEYQVRREGIVN